MAHYEPFIFGFMTTELQTYQGFDPYKIEHHFAQRGWETKLVKASNVDLVLVDPEAAAECGDGRFDLLKNRKKFGPRIFGGVNAIAALKTGGDLNGLRLAAQELKRINLRAGTHGAVHKGEGCGLFGLWKNGNLESAVHTCSLPFHLLEQEGMKASDWIKSFMDELDGKHFTLPDIHKEEGLTWNALMGTTIRSFTGDRFRNDDWVMDRIGGISLSKRLNFNAETVEKLKPDCKKVEILIP